MSLEQWLDNTWIRRTDRSAAAVTGLLGIARRELADARLAGMSPDGRFAHAYAAVRALCELALHASGYAVTKGHRQHELQIESLKFTLGDQWAEEADYFDTCRRGRNRLLYDCADMISSREADELLESAQHLCAGVEDWLRTHHSDLMK